MEIQGRRVLLLGGSGLVGMAVARELMAHEPAELVVSALTREEAEAAVAELRADEALRAGTRIEPEWGDLFLPEPLKDRGRGAVLADAADRGLMLDDLFGDFTDEVVRRSTLGGMLLRRRPEIIVDSVNTATAFAYQNIFDSAVRLRRAAHEGSVDADAIERHLATLYLPQLIRHVQVALEAMRQVETAFYVKVGTSGTGGMGLNIPFTHSEERPSRMLLAKSGLAGAQTLLLYLMARTPHAPVVKEVKPTAAIAWKRIAFGPVQRGGRPIERVDATRALPLDEAFDTAADGGFRLTGEPLAGVFVDAGENGLFSTGEFEALTSLGLMEYITPEEIAVNVVREIRGQPTGKDVVAALDASTSGPTYRAGVLREAALERMEALEAEHGVESVAYEMLGPPRLSKLLFEAAVLGRIYEDLAAVADLDPADAARRAQELLVEGEDLRVRMLSIGLPILLPDGASVLRGRDVKVGPLKGQAADDPRLPENGWVDLRPANWLRWSERARAVLEGPRGGDAEHGSRRDVEPAGRRARIRPGRLAAWVFRHEDHGERVKR